MALPKSVQVGGLRLEVVAKAKVLSTEKNAQPCHGAYDDNQTRIEIDSRDSRERQWMTLLHEMQHAAIDDSGLGAQLTEALGKKSADAIEESFVRVMSSQFLGALRAHGWLRFPGER